MGLVREESRCYLGESCLYALSPHSGIGWGQGLLEGIPNTCFSSTVNPCCYYPCQNQGVCVRFGLDRYQCDCTHTGYSGPNCTIRELRLRPLSPAPLGLPLYPTPAFLSGDGFLCLLGFDPAQTWLPMGLFSWFVHSVVVLLHAPCPLPSFWVLALSCVITPKGATYRFLFGPYLLIMGSSGLIRKNGLSGFHCPCS